MASLSEAFNLALQHQQAGRLQEAEAIYRQVLQVQPAFAEAYNNLGVAQREQGKLEEAGVSFRQALMLKPAFAEPYGNLGVVLQKQGKPEEAAACLRQAVTLKPAYAEAHNNLGVVLQQQGKLEEAVAHLRQALALNPAYSVAYTNLGNALETQGKCEEAVACYRQALALQPSGGVEIRLATILPVIIGSSQDVVAIRRKYDENLTALLQRDLTLSDPVREVGETSFHLAYHGCNDRDLQVKMAQVYERACPSLLYTAPHCLNGPRTYRPDKIKIGFISKYFKNHSISRTTLGVLANLTREKFRVYAIFVPPVEDDEFSRAIQQHADKTLFLKYDLKEARERIAEAELDILFYQDIGMEPFTYFLAFSRLAPVQCVSCGHPVTTGIRNMDYFISSENYEPENGAEHYSEQLIKLKTSFACYYKPTMPSPFKSRRQFGLDDSDHIYICPQNLFKFHPEFDEILSGILRADSRARLVLIGGKMAYWTELLLRRFAQAMPHAVNRITVLPPQNAIDFRNLIAISDVMLDTIHFGGFNTSLEAFAVGTPVVTMPSKFQRGRHGQAFYREMGFMECVAESPKRYIEIAVRLGTDSTYRDTIKAQIRANNHVLYENMEVVREFERFFVKAVDAASKPKTREANVGINLPCFRKHDVQIFVFNYGLLAQAINMLEDFGVQGVDSVILNCEHPSDAFSSHLIADSHYKELQLRIHRFGNIFYSGLWNEAIKRFNKKIMFIITSDTLTSDCQRLVERCLFTFNTCKTWIYAPDIDFTTWKYDAALLESATNHDPFLKKVGITDGNCWSLHADLVEKIGLVDLSINRIGWIDSIAGYLADKADMTAIRDYSIKVEHPRSRGYNTQAASAEMKALLKSRGLFEEYYQWIQKTVWPKLVK
jgi:predicted O-linked N-acetylglucosamine transferase (SPINDLY family)